jgi:four helix bundle protein
MGPDSVGTLEIWRDGMQLVTEVYTLTAGWPGRELYGLTAQARRAAVSTPSNIAEGVGRGTAAEAARFAQIALGSVYELHTLLEVAARLRMGAHEELAAVKERLVVLARRISTFARYKRSRLIRAS